MHLQIEVDSNLHQDGLPIRTHVVNFWADIQQDRFDLLEGRFFTTDHEGEIALFESNHATRHGGVEHPRTFFADLSGEVFRGRWTDGAHVDINLAFSQAGQYAMLPSHDLVESVGICYHGEDHVGGFCNRARRLAPLHTSVKQPLCLRLCAIVSSNTVACIKQSLRYATTHGS